MQSSSGILSSFSSWNVIWDIKTGRGQVWCHLAFPNYCETSFCFLISIWGHCNRANILSGSNWPISEEAQPRTRNWSKGLDHLLLIWNRICCWCRLYLGCLSSPCRCSSFSFWSSWVWYCEFAWPMTNTSDHTQWWSKNTIYAVAAESHYFWSFSRIAPHCWGRPQVVHSNVVWTSYTN